MGVRTEADDNRQKAKDHVNSAVKCLSKIIVDGCEGHDKYSHEYQIILRTTFQLLINLKL